MAHPRYWLLWLGVGLGWLVAQFPYPVLYWLGHRVGDLLYTFRFKRTRIAERNIDACFTQLSSQQKKKMLRKNMRALGLGLFETLICRFGNLNILRDRFEVLGEEHLQNNADQGVVLLVFHFASIELCAAALYSRFPLLVVYRPHDNALIEYTQRRRWTRDKNVTGTGGESSLFDRADVRGMIKALRDGKNLWIAADQDLGRKRCVFSAFFGVQTATPLAPAKLAESGRAKVLPVAFTRPNKDGYRIEIFPALENYPVGDDQKDADLYNEIAEQIVRREPESYLWAHRRFKTRPEGESSFYQDL